jgi:uncharacterized protein YjiS (DUF1127 family)
MRFTAPAAATCDISDRGDAHGPASAEPSPRHEDTIMSTPNAYRPKRPEIDHASLRADQPYVLSPDAIARLSQSAADQPMRSAGFVGWILRMFETLQRWRERAYSRRELARFDRRMLRDIGVAPYDAGREIAKPFWRE